MNIPALRWVDSPAGPAIELLDQTRLPGREDVVLCADVPTLVDAIRRLVVRGAPILGVAGAYGVALAALRGDDVREAAAAIASARPTAVNLGWGVSRALAAYSDAEEPDGAGPQNRNNTGGLGDRGAESDSAPSDGGGLGREAGQGDRGGRGDGGGLSRGAGPSDGGQGDRGGRGEGGGLSRGAGPSDGGQGAGGGRGEGGGPRYRGGLAALAQARAIAAQDAAASAAMAAHGLGLVPPGARILTHCNTGSLVSAGEGTAFAVILAAHRAGRLARLWVDETRPLLQGARLTAYEAGRAGIPHAVLADGAAATLMAAGEVDLVLTGADRIAADGSVANKVGTYGLAVLARHHRVPFVVVAPVSTVDLATPDGAAIPVEQRPAEEVVTLAGQLLAPVGTDAYNPAFDVTPSSLVTAIVTERGVIQPVTAGNVRVLGAEQEIFADPAPPPTWNDGDYEGSRAGRR